MPTIDELAMYVTHRVTPPPSLMNDWVAALHFAGFPIETLDDETDATMVAELWYHMTK